MKKILSILLVFVMIGLVAVSGCTDTADEVTEDEAIVDDENVTNVESSDEVAEETVVDAENTTVDGNANLVEDGNVTVSEENPVVE
ncbi:hypothetical protein Mpsy_3110 [Methanolobus psychrophilus R15]|nr:hypothetical protein Mpsy_3110 [Methanolobus psychrophilus R15]